MTMDLFGLNKEDLIDGLESRSVPRRC